MIKNVLFKPHMNPISLQDGMRQLMGEDSELERCKHNYEMLNMILHEWMPWHKENPDLSTVDDNKFVDFNVQVYIHN